jgi:hypothetical protein
MSHLSPDVRFWAKVIRGAPDECWPWTAFRDRGYGRFWSGKALVWAHRFAYELLRGPIPEGLTIDHLCRNRSCVNPLHMEPVPSAVNTRRGAKAMATHCKWGHAFTPENTYLRREGRRQCRVCGRERKRAVRPISGPACT